MNIVKLVQLGTLVIPLTTAEAVVVLHNGKAVTLDKVLDKKIEQVLPDNLSCLKVILSGTNAFITHSNDIDALSNAKAKIFTYDNHGHITSSQDLGTHKVLVNNELATEYTGNEDVTTEFGDDFKLEDSKIKLNWNNI